MINKLKDSSEESASADHQKEDNRKTADKFRKKKDKKKKKKSKKKVKKLPKPVGLEKELKRIKYSKEYFKRYLEKLPDKY